MIDGELDHERFGLAVQKLVERHEAFRTSFEVIDGELYQKVDLASKIKLNYRVAKEEEISDIVAEFIKPFDLSMAPLAKIELVRFANRHLLLFDLHHTVADGTSIGILIQDLLDFYAGKELSPLKIQYKDFAVWQNEFYQTEAYKNQEEYWLNIFADQIQLLDFPTDYARPSVMSFKGETIKFELNRDLSDKLNKLATRQGATLFMTLFATYTILLSKYSGQSDLIVGTGIAGRSHADLEKLIGMFVNTLAIRNKLEVTLSFADFLNEVKEILLEAYENQDYQFEMLVEQLGLKRDLSRNPLFDTVFVMQNMDFSRIETESLKLSSYDFKKNTAKFDFNLNAFESPEVIRFELEYSTDLFKKSTMERFSRHFGRLLEEVVKNPDSQIKEFELLSHIEKAAIIN